MTSSKRVTESNDTEHPKGSTLVSLTPFMSVTQKGNNVTIKYDAIPTPEYKSITIDKATEPYSFIDDNVTYTKE